MLEIVPVSLKEANAFVEQHHRHHKPVVGHKFSVGCTDGENIVGVAIVGRPVARYLDDGWTLEVNRLCTDGTKNACSFLYAAAWRAARAMGYHKLITYILDNEPGTSLRAAGWKCVGQAGGLRWTGKRRPEVDLCPAQMKLRWEIGEEAALKEREAEHDRYRDCGAVARQCRRRAYSMSEFERQIYADMKSTDRISIWIIKCMELAEFSCILTDEDIDGIAMVYKTMRKKDDPCKS